MKEDVIAANLANLRQSVNELKETVNKLSGGSQNHEQATQSAVDERTVYNSVAKSFCNCWNDALSILKKSVRKEQPDKIPFSRWIPKLIDLLKQKSSLIDYLYVHVCDYNTNRLSIEANTERILKRQDEILARVNELRCPLTIIPPNVNGLFLRGYHLKPWISPQTPLCDNCCHCHSLMGCGCFRQQYEVQGRIVCTLFHVSGGKGAASASDGNNWH